MFQMQLAAMVDSNPFCIITYSKIQLTLLACVNKAGLTLPALVIFHRKTMNYYVFDHWRSPGTLYGLPDKG